MHFWRKLLSVFAVVVICGGIAQFFLSLPVSMFYVARNMFYVIAYQPKDQTDHLSCQSDKLPKSLLENNTCKLQHKTQDSCALWMYVGETYYKVYFLRGSYRAILPHPRATSIKHVCFLLVGENDNKQFKLNHCTCWSCLCQMHTTEIIPRENTV